MIDMQETAIRTGGPLAQSTSTAKTDKADVRTAAFQPKYSLFRVLKSERMKLWSLRTAQITAAFMPVSITIINLLVLLFADVSDGTQLLAVDVTIRMFITISLVFTVILGGMFAVGGFPTGSIWSSLGAVPSHGLFAVVKIMVPAFSVLILSIPAVGISVVPGLIILPTRGAEQLLEPPAVRMIVGLCLCSMLMGLSSFYIGFLDYSSVSAISVMLGILWILPSVVRMLGDGEMTQAITARLLGVVDSQVFMLEPMSSAGGAWGGLAILAVNVVVMSVIAVGQFKRLDVRETRICEM